VEKTLVRQCHPERTHQAMVRVHADAVNNDQRRLCAGGLGIQTQECAAIGPLQIDRIPDHQIRHHLGPPARFAFIVLRDRCQREPGKQGGGQ